MIINSKHSCLHLLPLIFSFLLLLQSPPSSAVDFVINSFNSTSISLYGNATIQSNILTLTNSTLFQIGRALYPQKIRTKNASSLLPFSTSFIFAMAPNKTAVPGHGFVFLFTPVTGIRNTAPAQNLGLFSKEVDGNSSNHVFGVEFDVFRNQNYGDINDNHVGIDVNSLTSVYSRTPGYYPDGGGRFISFLLNDGRNYQVWIKYQNLTISVTVAPVGEKPEDCVICQSPLNLTDVFEDEMYVGFTAGTGNLTQSHKILSWSFSNTDNDSWSDGLITQGLPSFVLSGDPNNRSTGFIVGLSIGVFVLLVACGVVGFVLIKSKRRSAKEKAEMEEEYLYQMPGMPTRFSYEELKIATKNFSKKLGEGGFGSVFEGSLKDGSKIAVKCLEGLAHIKKSFEAEVESIGSIHHVNLVRLRGFCTWKSQRFLVYDFMSNGSLDRWIYHENREHVLEWECRKKIILDIAKAQYSTGASLSTTWTAGFDSRIILGRENNRTRFYCGFYCDGRNCTSYVFAISIIDAESIVWSANPADPVQENAILNFTAAGELVLMDGDGSIVWTTNTAGKSVVGMNLTDTGNLVLFDDRNSVVWQSFDYPTDCLLPGQKLFQGQKLISRASSADLMTVQKHSLQVTDRGLLGYVESNPPQAYYHWLAYGNDTHKGRRYIRFLKGSLSLFVRSSEPSDPDGVITIPQTSSDAQYMKLMPDGHLQVFEWISSEWTMISDLTSDYVTECSYPLTCGRNSICTTNQQCSCPALEYFRAVNYRQPQLGCSEITPLTCNSTQGQEFITLENTTYFTSTADMEGVNMQTCKQACLQNCSCKAAFFQHDTFNASYGYCFLPSEIFTMNSVATPYINASAFIKVQKVTSHLLSHQGATVGGSKIAGSTIGSFVLLLVVAIGFIMYRAHNRKSQRDAEMEEDYVDQVSGMPTRFSYDQLQTATENFSKKLGEGGFGSVYEGSLLDESKIAVKCLEGLTHIKKSFLAEVQSIGSIYHVNLVRLRGFCTWKSQRFLVYDFMSNGSLDKWIYHGNRERILE
ncbi:hypothetical protein SSX86_017746 [Deinandra increscens subsp. villosa]|uniref:Non-specific serine/threonine protein kinase n=1 Tax=Deinandra increscens subsp. villosa TaxID=3103831 RepID=A0AAP0CVX1_9ASTR